MHIDVQFIQGDLGTAFEGPASPSPLMSVGLLLKERQGELAPQDQLQVAEALMGRGGALRSDKSPFRCGTFRLSKKHWAEIRSRKENRE